jgi:hypothetical protein
MPGDLSRVRSQYFFNDFPLSIAPGCSAGRTADVKKNARSNSLSQIKGLAVGAFRAARRAANIAAQRRRLHQISMMLSGSAVRARGPVAKRAVACFIAAH